MPLAELDRILAIARQNMALTTAADYRRIRWADARRHPWNALRAALRRVRGL